MIPIRLNSDCINTLYHKLLNIKTRMKRETKQKYILKLRRINEWCKENIHMNGHSYTFPEIIQADFKTLYAITKICDSCVNLPDNCKNFIITKLYKKRFPRMEFMQATGVTVCPYCNRNFVNPATSRTMCDLDHFFSKDKYPILAVSFYNLVPVCHSCNHVKHKAMLSYSPHDLRYKTDDILTFDFFIKDINFLVNPKQIGIEIDESPIMTANIEELKLKDMYQLHTDLIQECIKKSMIFNPVYINYLYHTYNELFESEGELINIIYGNYLNDESYKRRPLSKLTSDIVKNILEILYE